MSGHASYDCAHDARFTEHYDVPLLKLTESNFSEYGHLVSDFESEEVEIAPWPVSGRRPLCPGTGNQGGVTEGKFRYWWDADLCRAVNEAVPDGTYITGRLPKGHRIGEKRRSVLVREANYHPDGGQVFYPVNKAAFVILLALPGDDISLDDFRAFYCDGSCGVQIKPNIWHQPVYPIDDAAVFLGKQGRVHACVAVDTVDEFNTWLNVKLDETMAV